MLCHRSRCCAGWAADRLRQVLTTARVLRQPPWQALCQLGDDTGVTELTELAAAMALAGTEGARVRASLSARAAAMRQAATAEMQTEAEKASSRMSVPLLVLGIAYLISCCTRRWSASPRACRYHRIPRGGHTDVAPHDPWPGRPPHPAGGRAGAAAAPSA